MRGGGGMTEAPELVPSPVARSTALHPDAAGSQGQQQEQQQQQEEEQPATSRRAAAGKDVAATDALDASAIVITPLMPARPELQLGVRCDAEVTLVPGAVRGRGAFGRVVEGLYGGQRVAVKLMADALAGAAPSESLLRSFAAEVEVLGRCRHPNVVRLLAACLGPPQPCLVMELMETSLDRLLHGGADSPGVPALMPLTKVRPPAATCRHLPPPAAAGLQPHAAACSDTCHAAVVPGPRCSHAPLAVRPCPCRTSTSAAGRPRSLTSWTCC